MDDRKVLAHFGVKGMRWGKRKARKQAQKEQRRKADAAEAAAFRKEVIKIIGGRDPMELYAVTTSDSNVGILTTGSEFVKRANMGMPFTSIESTGQRVGRPDER